MGGRTGCDIGDLRFIEAYERVAAAEDRVALLARMPDEELAAALAGASERRDPYLANVLATTLLNRLRHVRALLYGVLAAGLFLAVMRTASAYLELVVPAVEGPLAFGISVSLLLLAVLVGVGVYFIVRRSGLRRPQTRG